jgi:UDP-N-acetylglucosamine 2-epimerase (non-hydrolysing)
MKIAPIMAAFAGASPAVPACLVHTGQHYDAAMNQQYLDALGIGSPEVNLEVGSGSHAVQTAEIMRRFEPVVDAEKPAAVLVVGDVNSTIACALVAAKKAVPIIHVEAGLRSFDRAMPEEINRVLTDQLSDLLFTTERRSLQNLQREGIDPKRVLFVGNVMIDTLRRNLDRAVPPQQTLKEAATRVLGAKQGFAALTLHRPSNVDDREILERLLAAIQQVGEQLPVVFPVHPRTRDRIDRFGLTPMLDGRRIVALPPAGYLEMLGFMRAARVVLTDSGGIQEETTALGVPCVTLRQNTERPITADEGTNTVVGQDPARILATVEDVLRTGGKKGRIPELWDGNASGRIATHLQRWLAELPVHGNA